MSEMSEKARAAGKEKVKRYTDKGGKVDASGWTEAPCGFMDTQKKLGNRPISKQNLACGGKAAHKHGGRKGRDMGGPASSAGANYVANVPAPPQNRFSFTGQPSPLLGAAGMKKGGKADGHWMEKAFSNSHGQLHKELGVKAGEKIPAKKLDKAEHSKSGLERKRANLVKIAERSHKADGGQAEEIIGNRPTGGRMPKASGGSAGKGKMNVNIIIAKSQSTPRWVPPECWVVCLLSLRVRCPSPEPLRVAHRKVCPHRLLALLLRWVGLICLPPQWAGLAVARSTLT